MIVDRGQQASRKQKAVVHSKQTWNSKQYNKPKKEMFRVVHSHNNSGVDIDETSSKEINQTYSMNRTTNRETQSRWINIDISALEATGRNRTSIKQNSFHMPPNDQHFEHAQTRGRKFNDKCLPLNFSKDSHIMVKPGIADLKAIFANRKPPVANVKSVGLNERIPLDISKQNTRNIEKSRDMSIDGSDKDLIDLKLQLEDSYNSKNKSIQVNKPWDAQGIREISFYEKPVLPTKNPELNFRFLEQIKKANDLQKDSVRFKDIMKTKGELIMENLFKGKTFNTKSSIDAGEANLNSSRNSKCDSSMRIIKTKSHISKKPHIDERDHNMSIQDSVVMTGQSGSRAKYPLLRKHPILPQASKRVKIDELSSIRAKYSFLDE